VIFIQPSSTDGLFVEGLNAILVPRSTLLNSRINTSIFNFNPSSPGEMVDFKDASFYAYDIMSLVAQQGFEMSDTGALPKTLAGAIWEGLTGLVAGVADVLYQGLVAIGNFFASLGDAVGSWGQKLLGAINAVADAVKEAVQAVLDALNAIVKWVKQMAEMLINNVFMPIIKPILDALNEFKSSLVSALWDCYNESNENNGQISDEAIKTLDEVLMGPIFWIVMGIGIALLVVLTILMPFTLTFGFLIGILIAIVVQIVWVSMFSKSGEAPYGVYSNPVTGTTSAFIDTARSLLIANGLMDGQSRTRSRSTTPIGPILNIVGVILSRLSLIAFCAISELDWTGNSPAVISVGYAILSTIISIFCFIPGIVGYIAFILSLVFGIASLWYGYKATLGLSPAAQRLGNIATAIAVIGILVSITGLILDP